MSTQKQNHLIFKLEVCLCRYDTFIFTAEPFAVFKNALKCNKQSVCIQRAGETVFLHFRMIFHVKKRFNSGNNVNNEVQKYKLKCLSRV